MMGRKISALLAVFLVMGTGMIRASESLEDIFAQLEAAGKSDMAKTQPANTAAKEPVAVAPVVSESVINEPVVKEPVATVPLKESTPDAAAPESVPVTNNDTNAVAEKETPSVNEPADVEEALPAEEVSEQDQLFAKGKSLYRAGEYGKAEMIFEAMLAKDPYDTRATEYLRRTAKKIASREKRKRVASRELAMKEIVETWNPEPKAELQIETGSKGPSIDENEAAIQAMEKRLKSIVIPTLDFRDANIKDVVLFLSDTCRRLDPEGKGVNILLLGLEGENVDPAVAAQATANNITISIRDMDLYSALGYITEMAGLKFVVEPNVVSIMPISYVPQTELILRSYDIIPEVGADMEALSSGAADSGGGADDLFGDTVTTEATQGGPIDVTGFFSVVDWPTGSSATYQPRFHKLFVKNTEKNIQMLEHILNDLVDEAISKRSQQVEIEAKFVEFNEGALDELGFDWTLYDHDTLVGGFRLKDGSYFNPVSGYDGSTAGQPINSGDGSTKIYTDPITGYEQIVSPKYGYGQALFSGSKRSNQTAFTAAADTMLKLLGGEPATMVLTKGGSFPVDLKIKAMQQAGNADVLSAPKVTTKSGNEAIIRVVEVHRYPQDYDVETGQRTAPVVKPQDWEDYDLGVVLKVTPVVDAESNTIDLDLMPQITKFLGWDEYLVGYNAFAASGNNSDASQGNGASLIAKMPYFETRTVQTQVTVSDGSTVLMGGLVNEITETFSDRVPILGDIPYLGVLFRTECERSSKKNLIIFVKATQVDDHGYTRAEREKVKTINEG